MEDYWEKKRNEIYESFSDIFEVTPLPALLPSATVLSTNLQEQLKILNDAMSCQKHMNSGLAQYQQKGVHHGIGQTAQAAHSYATNGTYDDTIDAIYYASKAAGYTAPLSWNTATEEPKPSKPLEAAGVRWGEFIGWRIWPIREGYLTAYSANRIWAPGEPMTGRPGDYNDEGCWCFKEKSRAIDKLLKQPCSTPTAYGSVLLSGEVVEHELGYRAEVAAVKTIDGVRWLRPDTSIDEEQQRRAVAQLRERYGV